ncbi:WecB/TagA/CpsF family glycosyltransferase [Opitutus sp. ER46]|uniref:WecB/TagA/CpsF family glycosyltransferase n=1 Tax=Opitutus sp. ER46 TaxID=2161864 RepID=UPI000D302E61|nr:WecB/TagA/CpsF family glycosyltransferase [Opitutus sp. ER46]PTX90847.1 hypothetical protein DB354_19535 [Opitutus sp. ER46]
MNDATSELLPRATLKQVLGGRARLVGARCDARLPRGLVSPVEARLRMGIPYGDLHGAEAAYLARRTLGSDLGVVARALLAAALAPSARAAAARRPFVVSAPLDNLSIMEAVQVVLAPPEAERARLVYFVHAHALNQARFNRTYADVLARADALLPDGIGIRLAARLLGVAMRDNVNGTDLFPILCREAAERGLPLVLIGGASGVAEACARRMRAEVPGLRVPLAVPGFFKDADEPAALAGRIHALGRALVLVGMGSPRQELWAWEHLRGCGGATVLTVGGLFDFYSGRVRRAPVFWRETGMEWAYRLLQEPRRLARRYLVGNPLFLALALEQRIRGPRVPPAEGRCGEATESRGIRDAAGRSE